MSFLLGMGASLIGSAISGSSARRRASRQRKQAIANAKYQSPEELAWLKKTTDRSQYGDERYQIKKNLAIQPIVALADKTKTQASGNIIRQGLENSVIANEIRSKIDTDTQKRISEISIQLANMNEDFKLKNEEMVDRYNLDRSNRIRSITGQATNQYYSNIAGTSPGEIIGNMVGKIGSSISSSYGWNPKTNSFVEGTNEDGVWKF